MSVCASVRAITFEQLGILFLAHVYILTISRPRLSIKVTGSRSKLILRITYIT